MATSKRMLKAFDLKAGRIGRDFLAPDLGPDFGRRLIGIGSGKPKIHGFVVFVGKPVSARDVLLTYKRSQAPTRPEVDCLDLLEAYIRSVSDLPLGAVVEAVPSEQAFQFQIVLRSLPAKPHPLPP